LVPDGARINALLSLPVVDLCKGSGLMGECRYPDWGVHDRFASSFKHLKH